MPDAYAPHLGGGLEPEPGEHLRETFAPDRAAYLRGHLVMAALGGLLSPVVLWLLALPAPWVGLPAALLAIGVRGWYLASEVMGLRWHLTDRRVILPGGRAFRLDRIARVRPFFGDVQLITHDGEKHLIRYPADANGVAATIARACGQTSGKQRGQRQ